MSNRNRRPAGRRARRPALAAAIVAAVSGVHCSGGRWSPDFSCGCDDIFDVPEPSPCTEGRLSCDGPEDDENGCEVDAMADSANCGGCGIVCLPVPDGYVQCVDGACVSGCGTGRVQCEPGGPCIPKSGSDPEHCGVCGRSCEGAACTDGACEPVTVAEMLAAPGDIEAAGDDVVFASAAGLGLLAAGAGVPSLLTAEPVQEVAVSGSSAFVLTATSPARLVEVPLDGGPAHELATDLDGARALVVDATHAYWIDALGVARLDLETASLDWVMSLGSSVALDDLVSFGDWLFVTSRSVTSTGHVHRISKIDSNTQTVAAVVVGYPLHVAVDASGIYFAQSYETNGSRATYVEHLSHDLAATRHVAFSYSTVTGIRLGPDTVYVAETDGDSSWLGFTEKVPAELISTKDLAAGGESQIGGFALGPAHVHWTAPETGEIFRTPR